MIDPHFWWYVARASGLIAWVLATLSVVWGVLMSTRILRSAANAAWLQDLHKYFAGAGFVMILLHMVTLMLDGWLALSPLELLVPFAADYRPLALALGIIAFYLLVAIHVSSLAINRLPKKVWRGIHLTSYLVLALVAFHSGTSGTDVGSTWYLLLSSSLIVVGALSALIPVVMRTAGTTPPPATTTTSPAASLPVSPPTTIDRRTMVVTSVVREADEVLSIRLAPLGGGQLPPWHPGAHITLHLPNGLERQYSLCGDPAERHHFDIAVLRTVASAGGSEWIHNTIAPGMTLVVDGPLNHFEFIAATEYLFVAGGIGITPIKSMIESLPAHRSWRLIYLARSRATAAFAGELLERYPDRVTFIATEEALGGTALDDALEHTRATVYCCGPASLMARVIGQVAPARLHIERFEPVVRVAVVPSHDTEVACARTGTRLTVSAGDNLLEALELAGLPVSASCRKGVCGSCEVRVLEGRPEHLDSVMSDSEKDELGVMYPCVSMSSTNRLVLDL